VRRCWRRGEISVQVVEADLMVFFKRARRPGKGLGWPVVSNGGARGCVLMTWDGEVSMIRDDNMMPPHGNCSSFPQAIHLAA
jgi:hypothetical protein